MIQQAAVLRPVDSQTGREAVGQNGSRDCAGIVIPYYWPGDPAPFNCRLRRDNPDLIQDKNGKLKQERKYLGPPKGSNQLYGPPGITLEQLADSKIPIAITEGEKRLSGSLGRYELRLSTESATLANAVRASLKLADLGPSAISFPLLAATFRCVLGDTDFALHVSGETGAFKSEVAALSERVPDSPSRRARPSKDLNSTGMLKPIKVPGRPQKRPEPALQ